MLRVLSGLGAIYLEKKIVTLTEMGKLKGKGLVKNFKRREAEYEEKKKYLDALLEEKKKLWSMISSFYKLEERNKRILSGSDSIKREGRVFNLPLTVIAGQPVSLFRPDT